MQQLYCHLSTHEVYYLLNFTGYYTLTGPPHRALIPYHGHLLLLLNYVVLRGLWKIDVHLICTLVNKSLYY